MTKLEEENKIIEELRQQGLDRKYEHPGVYSISIGNHIVYIGKSRNMLKRLAQHIMKIKYPDNSNRYKILSQAWNEQYQISFDVLYTCLDLKDQDSIDEAIGKKEGEEIRKNLPPLNIQIPFEDDWRHYCYNKEAKTITWGEICERWKNNV